MINEFFGRTWSKDYNCYNLASDAWLKITGKKMIVGDYEQLDKPESPCIVFMSNSEYSEKHVGIFYNGKVLHLAMRGVQYIKLDLLKLQFKKVSFYK